MKDGPKTQQWLGLLESGEYEQATGALKKVFPSGKIRWCCVGLGAEKVSGCTLVEDEIDGFGDPGVTTFCWLNGGSQIPTATWVKPFQEDLGLEDGEVEQLTHWNDHPLHSFKDIARFCRGALAENIPLHEYDRKYDIP